MSKFVAADLFFDAFNLESLCCRLH